MFKYGTGYLLALYFAQWMFINGFGYFNIFKRKQCFLTLPTKTLFILAIGRKGKKIVADFSFCTSEI